MSVDKKQLTNELQKRGQFFQGPNEIWEIKELPLMAKAIFCYILSRNSDWASSYNNLARNLELDERTVSKHITTLENCNMLIVTYGANNAANFELLPPSLWISPPSTASNAGPASHAARGPKNAVPQKMLPSTAKNAVQVPQKMGHTQYLISNTSSASNSSDSQEERNTGTPKEAEGARRQATFSLLPENEEARQLVSTHPDYKDQWNLLPYEAKANLKDIADFDDFVKQLKVAVSIHLTPKLGMNDAPQGLQVSTPTPDEVLRAWRKQYGDKLDFISGKAAKAAMLQLVQTFKDNGLSKSDIVPNAVVKVCFENMKVTQGIQKWQSDVKGYLSNAIIDVYSSSSVKVSKEQEASAPSLSPEAKVYYERFKAEGKQPADFNGMSLHEYAMQRAYSDQFKVLDTRELERLMKEREQLEESKPIFEENE
jgi:hypothetical protein